MLLDLDTLGLSGLAAVPPLRALLPEVAIIVLTFLNASEYLERTGPDGADAFVTKSDLATDLLPAIRRAMRPFPGRGA